MAPSLIGGRRAAAIAGGLVAVGVLAALPPVRGAIVDAVRLLAAGDVPAIRARVLAAGAWAPLVSSALMILQAVIAPLPASPVTYANGLLFGVWWGGLLSWASALVAAAVSFAISRHFGRPVAERFMTRRALAWSTDFFARFGAWAVLIGRLLPVISFDVVSYGAGLTRLSFARFMVATAIGMIPGTLFYTYLGHLGGTSGAALLWTVVTLTALGAILMLFAPALVRRLAAPPSDKRSW